MAIAAAIPISRLRGIGLANMQRDALITTLGPFGAAEAAVVKMPDFATRFGVAEGGRFVLQFVYEYFGRAGSVAYDWKVFDRPWHDFATEVQDANWVHRGIANIRNFESPNLYLNLGDGIAIRGRNPAELATLGFDNGRFDLTIDEAAELMYR